MTLAQHGWLVPDWDAPGIGAVMTTRQGGVSAAPFDSMNVGAAVGDSAGDVRRNRELLADAIGARPVYLRQVHGAQVVRVSASDGDEAQILEGDASFTTEPGIACTIQVADCLPVLFAAPGGVAAAHAGWRGLAAGVLEATVLSLCDAAGCEAHQLRAWMGACIGPRRFEVGSDVLMAFGAGEIQPDLPLFKPGAPGKWFADLAGLARVRLQGIGVGEISGGAWCTVEDRSRFFSFRRDRVTGRMAAAIWLRS